MSKILFRFRQDLRVQDNVGLSAAVAAGDVLPVFVLDDKLIPTFGGIDDPRFAFVAEALEKLHQELTKL